MSGHNILAQLEEAGIYDSQSAPPRLLRDVAGLGRPAVNGQGVEVLGRSQPGDSGESWEMVYHSTGRSLKTMDGGFYIAGPGADDYWEASDKSVAVVERFGAIGDGTTDDATAIQAAFTAAASLGVPVSLRSGKTYKCDSTLELSSSLIGNDATLDFSEASSLTSGHCLRTPSPTYTALPALGTAAAEGDYTVTFASAPSVVSGDWVCIFNDTEGSWSDWRTNYFAGEFLEVASVSGSNVTFKTPLQDSYAIADVDLYHVAGVTLDITDLTVQGYAGGSSHSYTVSLIGGRSCKLENVKAYDGRHSSIRLVFCMDVDVINCIGEDDFIENHSDYGLVISNSQEVHVRGGKFNAARHGIAVGGGTGTGSIVNRQIHISGAVISSSGATGVQAADFHGNVEHSSYKDCHIHGNAIIRGDHIEFIGNQVEGNADAGVMNLTIGEALGCNFKIQGNKFFQNNTDGTRGCFIDAGGNTITSIHDDTVRGGLIDISGNDFVYFGADEDVIYGIRIINRGSLEKIDIKCNNNHFVAENGSTLRYGFACSALVGVQQLNIVTVDGNTGEFGAEANDVDNLTIDNNTVVGGYGLRAADTGKLFSMNNNNISFAEQYSGMIGNSSSNCEVAKITNNTLINCMWGRNGSSSTRTSLAIWRTDTVYCMNNFTVGNVRYVRLASAASGYTVGETITGGTSGATATVFAIDGDFLLVKDSITGTFQTGETITGGTSGAAVAAHGSTVVADTRDYSESFNTIAALWRSNTNFDSNSIGKYTNAITAEVTV